MPPRAKEHDHRVTHTSQDEFLAILAFFFDQEVWLDFHAPRISITVDYVYECMLLLEFFVCIGMWRAGDRPTRRAGRWIFTEIWQTYAHVVTFFEYPHQSRRTPFYLARSSEFSMSSDFLCFLRLNFQTSTGDITQAYLLKKGNTKTQRLAAHSNILANKDLQHFLVLPFQHLHMLPLLFESSVIN